MTEPATSQTDSWDRITSALDRIERAGESLAVRRTAAEPVAAETDTTLTALQAQNESLEKQLAASQSEIAQLRQEAARLAGLVDNALSHLDNLQEG